jgi:hypothetical protein
MPASGVRFVTSISLCDAAARAVAKLSSPAATPRPVWLFSVGPTRYVVMGTGRTSQGKILGSVFDNTFTWLADFAE